MKRILIILALIYSQCIWAQSSTSQKAVQDLLTDPIFSHASIGVKIMKGNGEILAAGNENKMLTPASNMKLISTGSALYLLGEDYSFATNIAHDGIITDGTLYGNIYIIGEADPTLGSKDSIATDINKTFAQWTRAIKEAGIQRIDGHIIGDGRWLDGMMEEPTWLWNDIGTYYGSGISGLNFYENMISFNASVDLSGDEAKVKLAQHYPSTPWMTITQNCTVGEKSTGDKLYMYTSDLAPIAQIRGTYGIDRGSKRVDFSNKFPEYTCAVYFKNYLQSKGISCTMGAADFKLVTDWTGSDSLKVIATTLSPALKRIVFETNHISNNIFAETLFRTLGKSIYGNSSYESSQRAISDVIKKMGVNSTSEMNIQDGSGLSRQNYVSADFICSFLNKIMDSYCFEEFIWSLPIPGGNGSLSYNMKNYSLKLRSRIRVKSGSMNGVRCYSGYVLPEGYDLIPGKEIPKEIKDQIIVFSIMVNNCISPTWKVRPRLDKFMAEMTAF